LADINRNIDQLETYRDSQDAREREFYSGLIQRGICFIARERDKRFTFAPSRFVGYTDNTMATHEANTSKHGGETNPAITRILGQDPEAIQELEERYLQSCAEIGVTAQPQGRFGDVRKYWRIHA
jgi:hypothetical protein